MTIDAGEANNDVNFIDELGRIQGSVTADEDGDNTGDSGLGGVAVELLDSPGQYYCNNYDWY